MEVGDGMKRNEVDGGVEWREEVEELVGINESVVESVEENVVKRERGVFGEMIGGEYVEDVGNGERVVWGDEVGGVGRERRMESDGEMGVSLLEERVEWFGEW